MGCDVHAFIEYDCNTEFPQDVGEIHLGRNYLMFAFLAGVRAFNGIKPIIPPKGVPDKLGYYTRLEYYLFVDEKIEETNWDSRSVNLRDANRWTQDKISTDHVENGRRYISHPDWHTPTWFSADEFEQVIKAVEAYLKTDSDYEEAKVSPIYYGVLAMLRALPDSRIIMWWDN